MQNPNSDAPLAVRKRIAIYGGRNPFGRPNWRICLAQHVLRKVGGIIHEWQSGELSLIDVDLHGKVTVNDIHPTSVRSGVYDAPRYDHHGWIVERWMPAHVWGSREDWNSHRSLDGTPLLGAYPNEGDYFMLHGPYDKCPEIGDIETAIRVYECERNNRPTNFNLAVQQSIKAQEAALLRRKQALIDDLEHLRRDGIASVLKSGSLAAQAVRQQLNKSLGVSSHSAIA